MNGKSYVGVTKDLATRIREHALRAKKEQYANLDLYQAWNTLGIPRVEVLALAEGQEEGFELERYFIKQLNTKTPNGYNMTDGGSGCVGRSQESLDDAGRKLSEKWNNDAEFREKMMTIAAENGKKVSEANKRFYATQAGKDLMKARSQSEWLQNVTIANQRPKSDETIKKMSESTANRWQTDEYRNKVNNARESAQANLRENNPEWVKAKKEKASQSMKAKWRDPEFIAKMKERKRPEISPERKAELAAKQKAARRAKWSKERLAIVEEWEKSGLPKYYLIKQLKELKLKEQSAMSPQK